MDMMAMSSAAHCHEVEEMIDTASPGMTPRAIRPLASAMTLSRNSAAVNERHEPVPSLYETSGSSGLRSARSTSTENTFLSPSMGLVTGCVYSLSISALPSTVGRSFRRTGGIYIATVQLYGFSIRIRGSIAVNRVLGRCAWVSHGRADQDMSSPSPRFAVEPS